MVTQFLGISFNQLHSPTSHQITAQITKKMEKVIVKKKRVLTIIPKMKTLCTITWLIKGYGNIKKLKKYPKARSNYNSESMISGRSSTPLYVELRLIMNVNTRVTLSLLPQSSRLPSYARSIYAKKNYQLQKPSCQQSLRQSWPHNICVDAYLIPYNQSSSVELFNPRRFKFKQPRLSDLKSSHFTNLEVPNTKHTLLYWALKVSARSYWSSL